MVILLMRKIVVLLVASIWCRSHAQLTYSIIPTWWDDPEPENTVSPNENRWKTLKENAENLGLTFAGRAEFPWVVDIRVAGAKQEFFSVGNLVSPKTVFTCCRCADELGDPASEIPRVYFGQMYLFEHRAGVSFERNQSIGGIRFIERIEKHQKCNIQNQYYDGARIFLVNEITPAAPSIGLMKITFDYRFGELPVFDLSKMVQQRRVCYVASFGRDYVNIKNHLVKDFKVKYRVYQEPYDLCRRNVDKICPNRHLRKENCEIHASATARGKELMCFQARAKVGVVCDHDRGAALVCDGIVFGLVILGVKENYCNDVLQVPFWVQKITMFDDWFEQKTRSGGGRELDGNTRSLGDTSLRSNPIIIPIIVYIYILY